jgi:diguanylate cyclase (GGDEF)-like protein/PAS domain S-box-containing protein
VAGKTVALKPSKSDPNSTPDGEQKPAHASGQPAEDYPGSRQFGENSTEPSRLLTEIEEGEERIRSQSTELSLLQRVRSALASELEVSGVLSRAVEAVAETYGHTRLGAYLLEGDELVLQHQVGYHEVIGRITLTEGVFGRAVSTGRPVLVEDVGAGPDALEAIEGVTSEICVPLFDGGEGVGLLNAQSVGGVKLTQNDLRVLVAVCELVGVALSRARLYARLRHSEGRYRALTQKSSDLVTLMEPSGIVRYESPAIEWMLGYSSEELIGKNAFDYVYPDDLQRVKKAFDEGVNDPARVPSEEYRFRHKDGSWRWLESVGTNLIEEPGVGAYVINSRDITRRKETEERLMAAEKRYRTLVEQIPAVTYIDPVDAPDTSLYTSPQIERMLGYTPEEWRTEKLWPECLHPDDRERILAADKRFEAGGEEPFSEEYRLLARDGSVVWVREEAVLLKDEAGEPLYWQGVFYDLTERKALEERLEHRAFHDYLTDLPNRQLFVDRLRQALDRTRRRTDRKVAVLFTDLDEFKIINDSLGHEAGDLLLTLVAERLERCLRPEDSLARFGGDEFVVLIEDVEGPEVAVRVARRIIEELARPFLLEDRELFASSSIGISLGDARTKTPEDLLRDADTAMYRAKEQGGTYKVFDPDMYVRARGRLDLEGDLRRTLDVPHEQLPVFYQPMASIPKGTIVGMEALLRWAHPERGLLLPSEFISEAERTGLIVPIGRWVLDEACRRAKEWQERHPRHAPLAMAVNLSARQLRYPELVGEVEDALGQAALDPGILTLEITESVLVEEGESSAGTLQRLKELGVRLAIDDFGVGYSSLSYLGYLPVDQLKLDRVLIANLATDHKNLAIVRAVVDLGHALGIEVVAEGVETHEEFEALRKLGCDVGQGNYWWDPRLPGEVSKLLASKLTPLPDRWHD